MLSAAKFFVQGERGGRTTSVAESESGAAGSRRARPMTASAPASRKPGGELPAAAATVARLGRARSPPAPPAGGRWWQGAAAPLGSSSCGATAARRGRSPPPPPAAARRGRSLPAPPAAGRWLRAAAVLLPALPLVVAKAVRRGSAPPDSSGGGVAAARRDHAPPGFFSDAATAARRGRAAPSFSGGGTTAARCGCSPLGSSGGGGRSLPAPPAAERWLRAAAVHLPALPLVVAKAVRRSRAPPDSSGGRRRGVAALPLATPVAGRPRRGAVTILPAPPARGDDGEARLLSPPLL